MSLVVGNEMTLAVWNSFYSLGGNSYSITLFNLVVDVVVINITKWVWNQEDQKNVLMFKCAPFQKACMELDS